MTPDALRRRIVDVPDFPKPGIVFKDITPLVADPNALRAVTGLLAQLLRRAGADAVLAIESRGFIFGAPVAAELGLPMHLVRKSGKLPRATIGVDYALEYGTDRIEVHCDALEAGHRFAIVDDLIATGGTAAATVQLIESAGADVVCCAFVVELAALGGRARLPGLSVQSLIRYD